MMKDPAFLFYSSDFLTGCLNLTIEERGQYITLLCLQHQKGTLDKKTIFLAVGNVSDDVIAKFKQDKDGNIYNERLQEEIEKRLAFTESRRRNGIKGGRPKNKPIKNLVVNTSKANENLIENENENENEIVNKDIDNNFEDFWKLYKPVECGDKKVAKGSKQISKEKFVKLIKSGYEYEELKQKTITYLDFCKKNKQLTRCVPVFFNKKTYLDDYEDCEQQNKDNDYWQDLIGKDND